MHALQIEEMIIYALETLTRALAVISLSSALRSPFLFKNTRRMCASIESVLLPSTRKGSKILSKSKNRCHRRILFSLCRG